ncbi:MAG TPA: DUF58 domain-containing protein, partial [Gaiellaceae bacterium]|nr:DUF58 domain-containing protein [Gaiellaceae bacterium]
MTRRGTTSRGWATLALGALCLLVAAVFGSHALYPLGSGLVLAVLLARGWIGLALRRPRLRRRHPTRDLVEGDDAAIELVLEPGSRAPLPAAVAEEHPGSLDAVAVELARSGRDRYSGSYLLQRVPRGRHTFAPVRVSVSDPFGLAVAGTTLEDQQALVVYPRLVELERLFCEDGGGLNDGRRLLLRRPAGFELHSVREHQQGESLRRVHWPSTARRGELMVKELEDAPREEFVVLLDGDAAGRAGTPPDSAFDAIVRAAGSIVLAQVRRGRRCVLALNSAGREAQAVASDAQDWHLALELLAAAEPDARTPVAALLRSAAGPAARALQLVVVTSRIETPLVDRLLERALSHRPSALVHVDAASFAGQGPAREPGLLRLSTAGVPVAVVRRGDDLSSAL